MAMKLGIAPTFQLSCRLRLLSFRQFSSSYALLVRFPISPHSQSTFPRLRLWRRSISSGPSDDSGWKKPKQDEPERKKAIAYDLSSGFLQDRRRTTQTSTVRRLPEDDEDDDDDDDDDWNNVIKNRASANRNSRFPSTSEDSDEEDSLSNDFDDDEIGGWMGNREPSNTFRRSSLYKQPLSYKQQPSSYKQASDYDTKPQKSERLVKFPPVPPAGPKPKQKPKVAVANRYEIYSDTPSFATETSETKTSGGDATEPSETETSGGDELKDFIPAVIKPEEPYIYSYTETPKVAPLGFREPVYSPFGPEGVNRPWTGRPPLAKSKKKPKEFDSFNPPPPGKKGVKPVNQPGPFLEGDGPKLGRSREEILGAPLLPAEVRELVMRSQKEVRQLNLGRDGLTHNMLNLVHEHWKRRRVCKIKCKGVPTVDMDNVCKVLEEKSGGKIIQRTGGVIYIFRGRNYNYKTRPVIPLMLWKPPTPIYPKLVEKAPPGLTLDEANEMRKLGRKLAPICRLAKNGVYINLVQDVRNAFRADDLVKVDCQGLNPSDFKKIGAKLKDLVPCVLISFERESILMWKGHNSPLDSQDGVNGENSGEAVPPFKRDLTEEGQELLERTLDGTIVDAATDEGDEIVASAADEDDEDDEIVGSTADEDDEDDEIVGSTADEDDEDDEIVGSTADEDDEDDEIVGSTADEDDEDDEIVASAADEDDESEASIDVGAAYEDDSVEEGEDEATITESLQDTGSMEAAGVIDEKVEEAVAEFESLWEEAIKSEQVLILDEDEVGNPDTIFEVVKTHFGGPLGAPAKPRNKRNSNELVGKKALQKAKPRLDPSVLDRVPKDPSGLLEIDELAKLLAP